MEALRLITHIHRHRLTLDMPPGFDGIDVEVLILPVEPERQSPPLDKEAFLQFLRNGPSLSDDEIRRMDEVKKEFRHWTADEF